MDRRGLSVTIVALMLAVLMISSTTASPGMNAMQSPGSEDGQPTAEHNTLYLFGNAQLSNCNSKFNNTNVESAEYGEDTQGGNGELNMKLTCRMEPTLDEDVILAVGEMIEMNFMLNLNGQWTNGQETCEGSCENLNVSLAKGGREVAIKEFDSLSDGENQVVWSLPVTEDLVNWNGSQESFTVEFRMVIKSQGSLFGLSDDEAVFGLFFTHPNNAPAYNATVTFPILNETAVEELTGGGGGDGDDDAGLLPGFTAIIGVGGLAAAALLRANEDEE
ncbi:MAG: hypothetical protein P8Q90_07045 [Candidatus Thalassarchaeaceae archaeon]|nr:hypothetical protein [Candidatus Thalassarchaeaceae archaeon]